MRAQQIKVTDNQVFIKQPATEGYTWALLATFNNVPSCGITPNQLAFLFTKALTDNR